MLHTGSIYAPMASVPMDEPEPITEETYEAMAPSPGHSGSGQVHHHVPPPAEPETEEMYTAMDAIEPPTTAPVATRPPPPSVCVMNCKHFTLTVYVFVQLNPAGIYGNGQFICVLCGTFF